MSTDVEGPQLSQLILERPARARGLRRGYRVGDVDLFFDHLARAVPAGKVASAQVRAVGFGSQLGGYDVEDTDALLAEVEDALARRERDHALAQDDQRHYAERRAALAAAVSGRLSERRGERFPRARGLRRGYSPRDVDALCALLADHFGGRVALSADDVRGALFRPRRGARGYREAPVDAFLDRVVELMVTFER
ncbi:DivIVA domain-containing protein [Kineococcus rhizosphaerae]|uniref:DivIVA domain-containing protein n=1 Tax=Kineococcus rhizosphaerae TaxID=559628 RepID=A0A2T0RBQ1_9ACTN|nr:DivIVA domain-containing protein [Kineococcus rhizosphaerae]PRY18583.1 DivIVA domain-containing protein [Kineococcus rhizosphaerae]